MSATAVAAIELRRSVRALRAQRNKLVGLLVGATGVLLVTAGLSVAVVVLGPRASGLGAAAIEPARGGVASAWLFVVAMGAFRTLAVVGEVDAAPAILLSVAPRTLLAGLLLAEIGRWTLQVGVPLAVLAGATAVGLSPAAAATGVGLAATLLVTGLPVGFAVGQAVRYLLRAVPGLRRLRVPLVGLVAAAYFLAFVRFGSLAAALARTPVGWAGDALLVVAVGAGDPALAGAGMGTLALAAGGGWTAARWLTVRNWFGDPPAPDDGITDGGGLVKRVSAALAWVAARPTRAVLRATLLRARRTPLRLSYAVVPAFAYAGYLAPALNEGRVPSGAATMAAGYTAWAVGAAFTLNPLGDEGPLLPVTVASGAGGPAFVRGRLLAAWLVGLPVAVGVVVVSAALVGVGPVVGALHAVYAAVLAAVAPVLAVGVGSAVPNFETRRVGLGSEAVVPSSVALLGFLAALSVVALPGGAALLLSGVPLVTVAGPALGAGGVAASAVLGAAAGGVAYRYAVGRFDGYEIDR